MTVDAIRIAELSDIRHLPPRLAALLALEILDETLPDGCGAESYEYRFKMRAASDSFDLFRECDPERIGDETKAEWTSKRQAKLQALRDGCEEDLVDLVNLTMERLGW